ncbi:MAG: beta-ketoacyl-ACP synthase II [Chloroflexi bacterium]|nr:beta-ketoacyl-ACP synthase II [Chloroflexota bacterium]MQC25605.1 beta-ketoacyl-[acyl-carrier-protein] synthase II [Chloroflexota bacterium]
MTERRVVVTGVGIICAVGVGREESWQAMLSGTSGITMTTLVDASDLASKVSGQVPEFDLSTYLDRKEARRMDRFTHLAVMAAGEALDQAQLPLDQIADTTGCMIGSGIGGIETLEQEFDTFFHKGPSRVSPFLVPMFIPDMAAGQVSIRFGLRGPNFNPVSACASGADALGTAFEVIRRGDADAMVAGGAEAAVNRMSIAAFAASRALSRNDDPLTASRPFDLNRDGFVLGEGAGILVLEEREQAIARGAHIICEMVGYGQSADAFHVTQPSENGEGAARAMNIALKKSGIAASDIDYLNAHGTSTPLNDKFETLSVKAVFGESAATLPISSSKSMIGHTLGAAGGIESAVTVLSIRDQRIHPTIHIVTPDPDCDLDYVPEGTRDLKIRYAMSNSLGFGGHNSSLIFKQHEA